MGGTERKSPPSIPEPRLRRVTAIVVALNFGYFWIEVTVALAIGSVSLLADSVDFLEDTAVNTLILIALGWPLRRRATVGRIMAVIILAPAVTAVWTAVAKFSHPSPPDPLSLAITAGGAIVVNGVCAWLLASLRHSGGSLSKAAFLAARNDVFANAAMILMSLLTAATLSGWPDIVLGLFIVALNATAAREVWQAASEERLAAAALDGAATASADQAR